MSKRERKSSRPYRLITEELPKTERGIGARISKYDELLNEFLGVDAKTVKIQYPNKSTNALMAALRSRIKKRDLQARVVMRKGNLYLTKK